MAKALQELENTNSLDMQLGAGREISDALDEMKWQLYKSTTTYIMKLALEMQHLHYQNHWEVSCFVGRSLQMFRLIT